MRIAARHPELLRSLSLLETAADAEPRENLPKYRVLNALARLNLLGLVAPRVMPIMFGDTFLQDSERASERERLLDALRSNRRRTYRAVNGVLSRRGVETELGQIRCPTLIVRGDEDRAIGLERVLALHRAIPGSELVRLPAGGHTVTLEEPEAVNRVLGDFLDRVERGGKLAR
jgi:pimeloyl-ACP methyl ester carboxylesterase